MKKGLVAQSAQTERIILLKCLFLQLTPHICVASLPEQPFARIVFLLHNRNQLD